MSRKLRNQWWEDYDWYKAQGFADDYEDIPGVNFDEEGVVSFPDNIEQYNLPMVTAEAYYDTVDVEVTICQIDDSQASYSDVVDCANEIISGHSTVIKDWPGEFAGAAITSAIENTRIIISGITFVWGRQTEFFRSFSERHPFVEIHCESTNIDSNYFCEDIFADGRYILNCEDSFSNKYPDIYREYLEEVMAEN